MDLGGRITSGDFLAVFREAIRDEVAKGNNKILINLEQVSYIDSSGLGLLIRLQKKARITGRQFVLVAPGSAVQSAIDLMRFRYSLNTSSCSQTLRLVVYTVPVQ